MNLILKQLIIIISTFLIILWFQIKEDKKYNKERTTFYEKYKFPLLVSSLIGLAINLPLLFNIYENSNISLSNQINEQNQIINNVKPDVSKLDIHNIASQKPLWQNKESIRQEIFTDLPDF